MGMEVIAHVTQITPDADAPTLDSRYGPGKRKRSGRKVNVTEKHVQAAKNLLSGKYKKGEALRKAGYSASSARIPGAIIASTPGIIEAIKQELAHYETSPAERATLIRKRLVKEVLTAKSSDAIRACEVAGKDKEVRLFEPETVIGVFAVATSDKLDKLLQTSQLAQLAAVPAVKVLEADCTPVADPPKRQE